MLLQPDRKSSGILGENNIVKEQWHAAILKWTLFVFVVLLGVSYLFGR